MKNLHITGGAVVLSWAYWQESPALHNPYWKYLPLNKKENINNSKCCKRLSNILTKLATCRQTQIVALIKLRQNNSIVDQNVASPLLISIGERKHEGLFFQFQVLWYHFLSNFDGVSPKLNYFIYFKFTVRVALVMIILQGYGYTPGLWIYDTVCGGRTPF